MKRPSLKKAKKDKKTAPHEAVAASPFDPLPSKKGRRSAKKQQKAAAAAAAGGKKPRGLRKPKKLPTPQEQAAAGPTPAPKKKQGRLGAPLRLVRKPAAKVAGLKGRARIVVWGLLALVVVIVGLQLRGGRDDEKLVRQALDRYETASSRKDYQALCDELLAKSYVKQTASSGLPCEVALRTALEDVRNPTLEVLSVEVNGDRAAARVRGAAAGQVPGEAVYTLVREDDAWRILPPRPASTAPAP
ncbi:MAG: hypothetical protein QOG94_2253 [Solirubrobacteraceae bacterium]|jgi:hypothetical protein|nr:hypothetical protein [Solirubrobacteraceae bacterium]